MESINRYLKPTPSGSNVLWWWPKSISQPTQPTQPQQPGEPIEPVNPGKPSQPTQPSQPSQPSQPVNPSEPIRNVQRPSPALTASERYIIEEVNKERTSRGLQPLEVDMQLVKVAKEKSYDMAAYAYFSHVSPTYGTVFSMLADYGVSYQRWREYRQSGKCI